MLTCRRRQWPANAAPTECGYEDYVDARRAADRAIGLDEGNALAWVARGGVRCHADRDWLGGVADLRKAVDLDPNEMDTHFRLGVALTLQGRYDQSIEVFEVARRLDPHSLNVLSQLGLALGLAGRVEEGGATLRSAIEMHSLFFDLYNFLAVILKREGRLDDAVIAVAGACDLTGHHPTFEALHASSVRLAGDETKAEAILRSIDDDARIDPISRAMIAVAERDVDRAVGHCHAAADRGLPLVYWFRRVLVDEEFPPDHPGVAALYRRLWPAP